MKLLILSDLHNEFEPFEVDAQALDRADVVILAGDIHTKDRSVKWALELTSASPKPVLLVAGNHEFYGGHFDGALEKLRAAANGTNVTFMENDELVLDGIRFLGCSLWTDFKLYEGEVSPGVSMRDAQSSMSDFRLIRATSSFRKLYPIDTVRRHEVSRAWLRNKLADPFDGKTVVISHHAPSIQSVDPEYDGDSLTPAYASNLSELMGPAVDLWIHGHMHTSFDYIESPKDDVAGLGTRVICNPRGYSPRHLNPQFDPGLIVEV